MFQGATARRQRRGGALLAFAVLGLAACSDDAGAELSVDLRTDLRPLADFDDVRVSLRRDGPEQAVYHAVRAGQAFAVGVRIAELRAVSPGPYTLRVELLRERRVVIERRVALDVRASLAVTVVITRDCLTTRCPGPSDPMTATECFGGRCVDPGCTPEHPELCVEPECVEDQGCVAPVACARATCAAGACLFAEDDGRCGSGERCSITEGCQPIPMDGGTGADAGTDTGTATDTGTDAGTDTGFDACIPTTELCDGVDNDCDPLTADGSAEPTLGAQCDGLDPDICALGVQICISGMMRCDEYMCAPERCDGRDNDCDSEIDEDCVRPVVRVGCAGAPYTRISDAIAAAPEGARIEVCRGTYPETIVLDDVGYEIVGLEGNLVTRIDASGFTNGIQVRNCGHLVRLQGLTIEDADSAGLFAQGTGGSMLSSPNIVIASSRFRRNATHGIELRQTKQVLITNSAIEENGEEFAVVPSMEGLGIFAYQTGTLRIEQTSVQDNQARTLGTARGAGVYAIETTLEMVDSRVERNEIFIPSEGSSSGGHEGSGIAASNSHVSLLRTVIRDNVVTNAGAAPIGGAGLFLSSNSASPFPTRVRIEGSTITANRLVSAGGLTYGGGIYVDDGGSRLSMDVSSSDLGAGGTDNLPDDLSFGGVAYGTPLGPDTSLYCYDGVCTAMCTSDCALGVRCASPGACTSGVCTAGRCE